jgi:hypothetical protein
MHKLGLLAHDGTDLAFSYRDVWEIEHTTGPERIVIAPSKDHINLVLELTSSWKGPRKILYILLTSRCGQKLGRYESPSLTKNQLSDLLKKYKDFFESDARHHVWVSTVQGEVLVVYDQHNVIYGYGDLNNYQKVIQQRRFTEEAVKFPSPHTHSYHAQNDSYELEILREFEWKWSPLADNDDY